MLGNDPAWEALSYAIGEVGLVILVTLALGWLTGHGMDLLGRRATETAGSGRKPTASPVTRQRTGPVPGELHHVRCYRAELVDWQKLGWA